VYRLRQYFIAFILDVELYIVIAEKLNCSYCQLVCLELGSQSYVLIHTPCSLQ